MFIEEKERDVQTFGQAGEKSRSKVALTPKMAQQLSNPYSDIVWAIYREIGNNGMDSNIAAGKPDVPVEIDLPTFIAPQITFRDYGTGMSYEFIMDSYNTWGVSTKDTRDKDPHQQLTGSLGRGSKVPWGYHTKSFVLTSWYDGKKMTFSGYEDTDGMPVLVHTKTVPCDPSTTGCEVTLPVATKDMDEFHTKANFVFLYWDVKPVLNGLSRKIDPVQYGIEGDNRDWGIRTSGDHGRTRNPLGEGARAIMGRVAYPIDRMIFMEDNITRKVLALPIDIHFSLGSLDFTESRESLRYTDWVKDNIIQRCYEIANEFPDKFANVFSDCSTLWEASKKLANMGTSKRLIEEYARFNGKRVPENISAISATAGELDFARIDRRHWIDCVQVPFTWDTHVRVHPGRDEDKNIRFVWDDRTCNKKRRYIEHNLHGYTVVMIRTSDPERFQDAIDQLGNPPYLTWADMEEPPVKPKQPAQKQRPVKKLRRIEDVKDEVDKDVEAGGYYVHLNNGEVALPDGCQLYRSRVERALVIASRTSVLGEQIYGIPATHKTIPNKRPQWVHALDALRDHFSQRVDYTLLHDLWTYDRIRGDSQIMKKAGKLVEYDLWPEQHTAMYRLMQAVQHVKELDYSQYRDLLKIAEYLEWSFTHAPTTYDYKTLADSASAQYPLLDFEFYMRNEDEAQTVVDHVNHIG